MSKLIALCSQVLEVLGVGVGHKRELSHYFEAITGETSDLLGVICQELHLSDTQEVQDLGSQAVFPEVRGEAQRLIGLYGV